MPRVVRLAVCCATGCRFFLLRVDCGLAVQRVVQQISNGFIIIIIIIMIIIKKQGL